METTDVTIEALLPQPTAVMRSIRTTSQIEPWMTAAFERVGEFVAARGAGPAGPAFARYHDRGNDVFEVEAGYPCTHPILGQGRIEASTLPGGAAVIVSHFDPVEPAGAVRQLVRRWIEDRGGRPSGDPWATFPDDQESGSRTRLVQPVEGLSASTGHAGTSRSGPRTIKRVSEVMTSPVVTARPSTSLRELVDLMVRWHISGIPITDDQSRLVGIVTEADLISKPAFGGQRRRLSAVLGDVLHGRDSTWKRKANGLTAAEVMTRDVKTVFRDDSVQFAARRMIDHCVKRLPVVADEQVVGMVARPDILEAMHRTDAQLAHDVETALRDPLRYPEDADVRVSVVDGVVTLEGTTRFPVDVAFLSTIVWRFPGVMDVVNHVQATDPDPLPPHTPDLLDASDYLRYMR
jgi:CBS domain-containing protein